MTHEHIEMVRRIDFDRLDILVSERIGALKLYAQNIDKAKEGKDIHDAICRDLLLPCVGLLTQFLDAVKLDNTKTSGERTCEQGCNGCDDCTDYDNDVSADCTPNHLCGGRMVHLPIGEQCDKCGAAPEELNNDPRRF